MYSEYLQGYNYYIIVWERPNVNERANCNGANLRPI
jgi:hypothetical protein